MNRRQFFAFNALLLTQAIYASNQQSHHQGHSTHKIHNTHSETPQPIVISQDIPLLKKELFPSKKDLKPLPLLKNESSKQGVFQGTIHIQESKIEIIKGKPTTFMTYNGLIPGPKIEAFEGDTIHIRVINHLNEPTTIHWHGLPVPPEQDGNPHDPILPHQERIYHFVLPKNCAGTYWYHPHPHYITSKQVARGLAGAFVVKSKDALSDLKEQDWLISDLRLNQDAQIPDNNILDWLNGREGEFVLINGQYQPKIQIQGLERIRIYNLCSSRYLKLHIPNTTFMLVGTDGGLLESPQEYKEYLLSPAERIEIVINAPKSGEYALQSLYYNRQKMMVKEVPETLNLATINLNTNNQSITQLPKTLRKFQALEKAISHKKVILSEMDMDHHSMDAEHMATMLTSMFLINGKTFSLNHVEFQSKIGEVEEWEIINESHMDHPFHIHGTQFECVESKIQGKSTKPNYRCLKDTINLRPYETIKLRMKQDFKGKRMFHCHILEHEDLGMMSVVEII
ncbi:bilirubin oxidase [Helicobacter monodelphidis]|uniref:multicopper oxidase family protein n=1 Tax=Helicobacter sp. 15-1451 TaxID=2004995 RepID=UPI000DCE4926|nr:multicopper oxidase family protein [Helicobacter sp. 15-1451]RAX58423.1 bilirubin oxidase [Helicobacter sp. 15-1451]